MDCDFDEDATAEHRRLQRTPTPYYEDPPSLLAADTLNVDDMDATSDSTEGSVTGASGTTEGISSGLRENVTYSYDT